MVSRAKIFWPLLVCSLLLSYTVYRAQVTYVQGDSALSMILGQAILEHGQIKLDPYEDKLRQHYFLDMPMQDGPPVDHHGIQKRDGHLYSFFPIGNTVFAMPIIAGGYVAELDFFDTAGRRLQSLAAAATCLCLFLLMYQFARRYFSANLSLAVAVLAFLGSSLSSTLGTALWSHNFGVLFAMAVLYLVVKSYEDATPLAAMLIGALLFGAYLSRPTFLLLTPITLAVMVTMDRQAALRAAVVFCCLALLFVAFSYLEYGQLLPDYYYPQRLANPEYWTAFYGNLISPARGLLVYSPVLVFMLLTMPTLVSSLRGHGVLLLFFLWPAIHLLVISNFAHWWAGFSYGPRFMVDVMPVFYLLLLWYLKQHLQRQQGKRIRTIALISLGLLSVAMHGYQGMYNTAVFDWNLKPNIDQHPELLFDWRYPQFLHTDERQAKRLREYQP